MGRTHHHPQTHWQLGPAFSTRDPGLPPPWKPPQSTEPASPRHPPAPHQAGSWLQEMLISISALTTGSPRECHPDRFCCQHCAREQAAGVCNAPAKSWSWLNNTNKQAEWPGFHSCKASALFISPSDNSQQITSEHPIHSASIRPAVPGELILTFS